MINANDFKNRWNAEIYPLIEYNKERIAKLEIPIESKEFLVEAGLPESAAPFLSFESIDGGALLSLKEKYNVDENAENIFIGFTGEGDIITLENESGKVIIINHETSEKVYLNNSVPQLAESLLEYSEFIKLIKETNGSRAYLNNECSKEQLESIKNKLILIDEKIIDDDSFWANEILSFEE